MELQLNLRRKAKRRLPSRNLQPLVVPEQLNQSWSMDFMSDSLDDGDRFRTFNVIDDYNRETLATEIDLSLPAPRVIRVLDRLVERRGYPRQLHSDNGPEFISVQRFNRTYREEILDAYIFQTIDEVRDLTRTWIDEYNGETPYNTLGRITPLDDRRDSHPEGAKLATAQEGG